MTSSFEPQNIENGSLVRYLPKVESSNVHASVDQSLQHGDIPAGRSQGAENLGVAFAGIALFENHGEVNVSSAKFRSRRHFDEDVFVVVYC